MSGPAYGAQATTGASVLAGGGWSTLGRFLPQLYTLVISVAAARFLGAEGLGRQSFIAFVQLSAIMLLTGGLPVALMRYVGETVGRGETGAVRGLIRWAWRVEGVAALVAGGVLVVAALAGAEPESAWVLAGVAAAIGVLNTVPSSLLYGVQRWREATIAATVGGGVGTAATIAVLALDGGITGMFAVEAVMSALTLVWVTLLSRGTLEDVAPVPARSEGLQRQVTRYALIATTGVVLNFIVWRRSEFFFLDHYSSDTQIAFYSIAFAVVTALVRLPEAFAGAIAPAFATLFGAGAPERIRSGFGRAARLMLLLAFPLTAAGLALGPAALELVYTSEFEETGPVLRLMLLTFPVLPLVYLGRSLLVGIGRQGFLLASSAVAAVVNVALNFALIPPYAATGAALANGGAQLAAGLPIVVYAGRLAGPVSWQTGVLARAAAASALAGVAGFVAVELIGGTAGLAAGALAGAAVLAVLSVVLRVLPADDAAWLDEVAGRRLGGFVGRSARLCAAGRGRSTE